MDLTKRITDKYCLEVSLHRELTEGSILYNTLYEAYKAGFREYQLFKDYNGNNYILCVWAGIEEWKLFHKSYEVFPFQNYYNGEDVTCFAYYDGSIGKFVPYKPTKVIPDAP